MLCKSNDIIEVFSDDKVLLYNYLWNSACIVDKDWYINKIKEIEVFSNDQLEISNSEVEILQKNGILYDNEEIYQSNAYKFKILKRNTSLDLNTVYFHITQKCNLSCSYCYNKENLNKQYYLSTEDIIDIIKKLKNVGTKTIILTGGEPLLRKDILNIIKTIKEENINCELLTNGILLKENKEILPIVDNVIISLDTFDDKLNERIGLDLYILKSNLMKIDLKYRNKITIRSVISKKTEDEWYKVKQFAENNNYKFTSSILLPNSKSDIKKQPNINKIELDFYVLNFGGNICAAAYKEIAIDSNGDIYPCQSLIDTNLYITNIFKEKWFEELDKSIITNLFRKLTVDEIEHCRECKIRYLCGGGCRAIPYKIYDGLHKKSECMCDYQQSIVYKKLESLILKSGVS